LPNGRPQSTQTKDGRDFIAVLASEDVSFEPVEEAAPAATDGERTILYYRHPMGLPDTSPVPKQDSMNMELSCQSMRMRPRTQAP